MRTYAGIAAHTLPPAGSAEFTPRLREMLVTIDLWARDASRGFGRITQGESPVAGGVALSGGGGVTSHHALTDLTTYDDHSQYLYLSGRIGGQTMLSADTNPALTIKAPNSGDTNIIVQEWASFAGSPLAAVYLNGAFNTSVGYSCGSGVKLSSTGVGATISTNPFTVFGGPLTLTSLQAVVTINGGNAATQTLKIIAAAAQTGAITEWYDGTPTKKASIDISGAATFTGLTMTGGTPGAGKVLTDSGAGTGIAVWATPSGGGSTFSDSTFDIYNTAAPTKIIAFSAASITAGQTRTLTVPDASGTLPLLENTQTWTKTNTFSPATDISSLVSTHTAIGTVQPFIKLTQTAADGTAGSNFLEAYGSTGAKVAYIDATGAIVGFIGVLDSGTGNTSNLQPLSTFTSTQGITLVDGSGTMVIDNATYTGSFNVNLGLASRLISSTATSGTSFSDTTTANKKLRFVMSGAATAANNIVVAASASTTTARAYTLGEQGGRIVVAGKGTASAVLLGSVDLTGQTATLADTTVMTGSTGSAGLYRVSVYMLVTTADVGAATLTANVKWNDGNAQTNSTITLASLITTGSIATGSVLCYAVASQNITVGVTLTKTNSPAYTVQARIEALG